MTQQELDALKALADAATQHNVTNVYCRCCVSCDVWVAIEPVEGAGVRFSMHDGNTAGDSLIVPSSRLTAWLDSDEDDFIYVSDAGSMEINTEIGEIYMNDASMLFECDGMAALRVAVDAAQQPQEAT